MPKEIIAFPSVANGPVVHLFDDQSAKIDGVAAAGTWRTDNAARQNLLQYTVGGATQAVDITYTMNARNQLGIQIGAVAKPALCGQILIEAHQGIQYNLIAEDTTYLVGADGETPVAFFVYGTIEIDPKKGGMLAVRTPPPAKPDPAAPPAAAPTPAGAPVNLTIVGNMDPAAGDTSPVVIDQTTVGQEGEEEVADLLRFKAVTKNAFPSGDVPVDAGLDIRGSFGLQDGQLMFNAAGSATPGSAIRVSLVGALRGTAFGFEFRQDASAGATVFFTVAGQIKGEDGKSNGQWTFTLGYSKVAYTADVVFTAPSRSKGANGLTLNGTMHLAGSGVGPTQIAMALDVTYGFANGGQLEFQVNNGGGKWILGISGALEVSPTMEVKFALTNKDGGSVSVSLVDKSQTTLLQSFKFMFEKNTGKWAVGATLHLSALNGHLLPPPQKP